MMLDETPHKKKKRSAHRSTHKPDRSPPMSDFRLTAGNRRVPRPFEDSMIPDEDSSDAVPQRSGSTPTSPASPSLRRRASASVFGFARNRSLSTKGFSKKGKEVPSGPKEKPLKASKGIGGKIMSSLSPLGRRHSSLPDPIDEAPPKKRRTRRKVRSNNTLQLGTGFVATPRGFWEGKSLLKEMVRRLDSYHLAMDMTDELPSLVVTTRVLLSVFTSFPPKMLVCLLCRFEGNSKAVVEELELLGWHPAAKHDFNYIGGGLMSDQRDVHFTTQFYHGAAPTHYLVKMLSMQPVGTYLTYTVATDHGYQYYCLRVTDEQSARPYSKNSSINSLSLSPASSLSSSDPPLSSSPKDSLTLHLSSSQGFHSPPFGSSPRGAVIVCNSVDSPAPSAQWLDQHGCTIPTCRKESFAPSPALVPLWVRYACESDTMASPREAELREDPAYVLEILTAMTSDMALMDRINTYQAKLTQIKDAQDDCECDERSKNLAACHADVKLSLQAFKLSLYQYDGSDVEDDNPAQTVGFLSLSSASGLALSGSDEEGSRSGSSSPRKPTSNSESLTVGFMWAAEVPPALSTKL